MRQILKESTEVVKIKNEIVEIRKSGKFYNVFSDDAIILHYLLKYKIVLEKGGVGFPETALNKVINTLENEEISYKIYDKNEVIESKDFKKINNYKSILKKGMQELSIEERFLKIEEKIKNLNAKELDHILELIEDAIS